MRNFLKFGDIDPVPLLVALKKRPQLWYLNNDRHLYENSPHRDAESILLRYNLIKEDTKVTDVLNGIDCIDYPEYDDLPEARKIVAWLMARVEGEHLGRVMLSRLPKDKQIYAHADKGRSFRYFERFHIPLQTDDCLFQCGEELVSMLPGEVWWFDNQVEHSVLNRGDESRIHLIVDIKTRSAPRVYTPPERKQVARETGGKVEFGVELFHDCVDEIATLVNTHFEEAGLDREAVPLDVDWERYIALSNAGEVLTVTARINGQMVGYFIALITPNLHYKSSTIALTDSFFILKEYREGMTGVRLFKYTIKVLKEDIGVDRFHIGCKLHIDMDKIFKRLGFKPIETYYSMVFQE